MQLNSFEVKTKKSRKRVGRGIGSGHGKTCGRGHKGQGSRSGSKSTIGFEGGQMPLQRRLPKRGFTSSTANLTAEVRLHELEKIEQEIIDLQGLKVARIVPRQCVKAKVIASGQLTKTVKIRGLAVTKGARAAIEMAGGSVEDVED